MEKRAFAKEQLWDIIPSADLEDYSRDRLYAFREALATAKESGFQLMPSSLLEVDTLSEKAVNEIAVSSVKNEILHGGNGFYVSPEYSWLTKKHPDSFSVVRTAKAETSAHGVFFGILQNAETGDGLPVAVKPCTKNPSKAYIDWVNNSMIGNAGKRNFKPVGFFIHSDRNYSITELEVGVETLDNSDWSRVLKDMASPTREGQRQLLAKIGESLADLHLGGIYHGDTQFKNIAVDISGKTYFIDWEAATLYGENVPEDKRIKKMGHDLKVLLRSAAFSEENMGVGLLSRISPSLQWEYFKSYTFDAYMEKMLENDHGDINFQRLAEVEEDLKEYVLSGALALSEKRVRKGQESTAHVG